MNTAAALPRFVLMLAALVAMGLLLPSLANPWVTFVAGLVALDIVIALAFNFLFATVGVLSFGQAGFVLVGAYSASAAIKFAGVSILPALLAAGLASALAALAIGIVALRRVEGVYFAVLSLAFASLGYVTVAKIDVLGRDDGLAGITRPDLDLGLLAISIAGSDRFYRFIVVVCGVLIAVMWLATNTQFGRILRAIRQDPVRAGFLGVNIQAFRIAAFVLSGVVTGTAGALIGPWTQIVTPDLGYWVQSTNPILHTMLGGSGFFWGPAVGAVLFAVVGYLTRTLIGMTEIVIGGLLLAVVLAIPGGLLGLSQGLLRGLKKEHPR